MHSFIQRQFTGRITQGVTFPETGIFTQTKIPRKDNSGILVGDLSLELGYKFYFKF